MLNNNKSKSVERSFMTSSLLGAADWAAPNKPFIILLSIVSVFNIGAVSEGPLGGLANECLFLAIFYSPASCV